MYAGTELGRARTRTPESEQGVLPTTVSFSGNQVSHSGLFPVPSIWCQCFMLNVHCRFHMYWPPHLSLSLAFLQRWWVFLWVYTWSFLWNVVWLILQHQLPNIQCLGLREKTGLYVCMSVCLMWDLTSTSPFISPGDLSPHLYLIPTFGKEYKYKYWQIYLYRTFGWKHKISEPQKVICILWRT